MSDLVDYAKHILCRVHRVQRVIETNGLGAKEPSSTELIDKLVTDEELRTCTRSLYVTGHYAQAVEEAYKYVNNLVKSKTGLSADGAGLMKTAFGPSNPVLKLNDLNNQSQRDQQLGYMEIFAGCMTGIRNPRAHQHQYLDSHEAALELLTWANHLVCIIRDCKT